jgi:sec-independent protein translocase protein TatA
MPFGVSLPELLILLAVLLLVFGPKRLPEMGRSLGRGVREFKDSISGLQETTPTPASPSSASLPEPPSAHSEPSAVSHPSETPFRSGP